MKSAAPSAMAAAKARRPADIREAIGRIASEKGAARFAAAKALLLAAEDRPRALYPFFEKFVELTHHENSIIKWTAIRIVAALAVVDRDHRIDGVLADYLTPITGPVMITAANTIQGAARIALARPDLADAVIAAILKVESARYRTAECRNVAIGHAITALAMLGDSAAGRPEVAAFVTRQLKNSRPAIRTKAAKFVKRASRSKSLSR